ncbi:hypothetical protein H9Y04_43795 [Streptomyces sp. TRM66268-LWL]|uniref:DUF5602 domain-containing protein n=1 Tax=Streptomyces polyasparticus TaxID=2767826 RepID=A0ABR7SVC1_9ACTN|nr:hypothetical protein [Streptomyces polyasparticus]MBC9719452.1 hypothetical protein [Streptomyces polyasparticus]
MTATETEASMYRSRIPAWRITLSALLTMTALAIPAGADTRARSGTGTIMCAVSHSAPHHEITVTVDRTTASEMLHDTLAYPGPCAVYGAPSTPLGAGSLRAYAQIVDGSPQSVGVVFPRSVLSALPTDPTDGRHCYDTDNDQTLDPHTECIGGHERPLALPSQLTNLPQMPLRWAMVNYNPAGHGPPHIYDTAHFDFHFYLQPREKVQAIRMGPCGVVINCDDHATATEPIPARHLPLDYRDRGFAEARMGNHLVDSTAPEWHGRPLTHTFIYGAYAGEITFLEPMLTQAWLEGLSTGTNPTGCHPIKQPRQWQAPGAYLQDYCVRFRANRCDYTVSLENFLHG